MTLALVCRLSLHVFIHRFKNVSKVEFLTLMCYTSEGNCILPFVFKLFKSIRVRTFWPENIKQHPNAITRLVFTVYSAYCQKEIKRCMFSFMSECIMCKWRYVSWEIGTLIQSISRFISKPFCCMTGAPRHMYYSVTYFETFFPEINW